MRPGIKKDLSVAPTLVRPVSSRDVPTVKIGANRSSMKEGNKVGATSSRTLIASAKRAHAVAPVLNDSGWDDTNYWSADKPENRVGDPPGVSADGGAGSGNFQFAAPILSLPGRGINISLGLAYNSRLWNKAGSQISYDNDRGWPAPGFSLGFGKLLGMGINNGCMLVDADGTRHGYTGSINFYNWGTFGVMHTTDGSFIDYSYWTGTGGAITWAQARLPNGTVINYGAYSQAGGGVFPTSIEDANGNFIVIAYVNNAGPRIQNITDTLGRSVSFSYNPNNLLTAISAAGLGGAARTLVRLHYHQISLDSSSYSFSGLTASVRDSYPWMLDAIYYPATSTGYWLNGSDSYSSYGMLAKVVEERNMGFSASSLNDMGSVSEGSITRSESYNYPLYVGDSNGTPSSYLTDAPTYTSTTERWSRDGTNFDQATTQYEVHENDSPRSTTITLPNGTKNTQLAYNHPGQYDDGLVYHDETYVTAGQVLQSSTSVWEPGDYNSPRPHRIEKTDELQQTTAAEFSYGGILNQVTEVRDYGYGGGLLRATRTSYQNIDSYTGHQTTSGYIGRHIFNLPLSVEIYASDYSTRVSHTDYQYDGQTPVDTPGVVYHDDASNPYAPTHEQCDCAQWDYWQIECLQWNCYQVSDYQPATNARGNVTQVTSYADGYNLAGPVTETRSYDITGNVVTASTSCCEQTSFAYSTNTQYAYSESKTRGSASNPYAQVTTSATYDFYTGLGLSGADANGHISTTNYYADTLRPMNANSPSGAYSEYVYNDVDMTITATTHAASGGIADQNLKYLNGRGQVRHEQALSPNSSWDQVDSIFDSMGQVIQQTSPYKSGDPAPTPTTTEYDALGRVKTVTAPDGSVTRSFYNEAARPDAASSSPGETTRVQDAWGRERWGRTDASGRLVEVVEPNPNGSGSVSTGGLLTTYAYNTLGNLTTISSWTGGQVEQSRSFAYDSLGRLTAQKLAEVNATLDNNGGYHSNGGTWSDVFAYDERSNLTSRVDARGVKTVYGYSSDPLNRLQSVSWDTSGFGDSSNPILPAATVTYQYRTKSSPSDSTDVTQLASITTANVSTESYGYDDQDRVSSKTLTLASRPSFPFQTDYIYDTLDRISDVRYPAEYGNGSQARKLVHHEYDIASRITALSFDGQSFASNIAYNAASQTTSLTVGTGTSAVNEAYNYNPQTGLLDTQTIVRNGATLLSLSYEYTNASGKRTGQLTKIYNNLDHGKDRSYSYDALGRLVLATGGPSGSFWSENYGYDRYGNRTSVSASGHTAKLEKPAEPKPNLPTDLIAKNNKVDLPSWLREKDNEPISDANTSLYRPSENRDASANSKAAMPLMPQSSPKIAFASTRDGTSQIYTMNTDGSGQTRITNNQTNDEAPRWSSNSRIAFQSDRDNPFCDIYDIYAMNSDGSGQTRLTTDANDDRAPVWAPDGSKIAFQSLRNGTNYQIYVMNSDGSGQTNVSNSGANDTQPSWSPDGTKIAFASDRDHSGYPSVYVMNSNGANQTCLTFDAAPYSDNQPSWSPDGSKIAFTSTRNSSLETWTDTDDYEIPDDDGQTFPRSLLHVNKDVYVMLAGGSGQTRLTSTPENDESPFWSADGSRIIFRSDRERDDADPIPQIWSMNTDGTGLTNLSNNQSPDYSPSCQYSTYGGPPPSCVTIDQFIQNFYQGAFGRPANQNELQSWSSQLRTAYYQGHLLAAVQYMGRQLFKSPEYVNRGRDYHWYVYDLYWAYLQRQPDSGGWSWWEGVINSDYQNGIDGREHARLAFETDTTEFAPKVAALCVGSSGSSGMSVDGLANQTYDHATNRVTTAGFAYDVAGNQTSIVRADGSAQRFQYDAANRLIQVRDGYGYVLETFTYGSSNERLIADDNGYRTYFDCEGGATIAEYYESGGSTTPLWNKSYVYLGNRLLSTLTPNGQGGDAIEFDHPDRLGTRIVTNPTTGTFFEQQTLPFGSALDETPTAGGAFGATNRRFTTYDRSATTGLDYAYNRHYDSQQGRFTQVDPSGLGYASLLSPQTLNLYAYCNNDPINHTDPSGLGFFSFLGKVLNVIGKILKVVAVIVAVVLIVAAVSLIGTPGLGAVVAKALISAGLLLTNAFAPPKIAAAAGILVGIFTMKPPIIFNLAAKAGGHAGLARVLGILVGASSVNDFLQDQDPKPPDEPLDVVVINHSERKSIGQRILSGIMTVLVAGMIAKNYVDHQSDRLARGTERYLNWVAEHNRFESGMYYSNGEPIYYGVPVAGGLQTVEEADAIMFGHGARHLVNTGLTQEAVENAVRLQVKDIAQGSSTTGSFWGRVVVGGRVVEYRAYTLPNGTINVGTYYIPPGH